MDERADRLYGLPLADFVAERTALVKQLRAEGRRDDAAAVAKLPKPTVAAWAANQVLRTQGQDARELFAAGDALAGANRDTLRAAIARHREALGRLAAAASGLLDPDGRGLSATTLEKVQQTLNAASLDPEIREEAQAGRLVTERVYSGLGAGFAPAPASEPEPEPPDAGPSKAELAAAREQAAERRRHAAGVKAAERRLAAAEEQLRAAQERVDEARAALDDLR